MSAFMVDDDTINRVVTYLATDNNGSMDLQTKLAGMGFDLKADPEAARKLGEAMFALNIKGVEARYGEGEAKEFRPLDYQFQPSPSDRIQTLKSLRCWLYQCSERDIPETSPLYAVMDEFAYNPANTSLSKTRKYEESAWG